MAYGKLTPYLIRGFSRPNTPINISNIKIWARWPGIKMRIHKGSEKNPLNSLKFLLMPFSDGSLMYCIKWKTPPRTKQERGIINKLLTVKYIKLIAAATLPTAHTLSLWKFNLSNIRRAGTYAAAAHYSMVLGRASTVTYVNIVLSCAFAGRKKHTRTKQGKR